MVLNPSLKDGRYSKPGICYDADDLPHQVAGSYPTFDTSLRGPMRDCNIRALINKCVIFVLSIRQSPKNNKRCPLIALIYASRLPMRGSHEPVYPPPFKIHPSDHSNIIYNVM